MQRLVNDLRFTPSVDFQGTAHPTILSLQGASLLLLSLILVPGCGPGDAITMPTYTPEKAAQAAMAEYDVNHDGFLDAKELEKCPALKSSLEYMDKNSDKRLNAEEIAARIQVYADTLVGLKPVGCRVLLDGRPLEGATVTYVPEKFMGSSIRPASGVTDARGGAALTAEGEKVPGAQPGFYRVQISKKSGSGQEMIPARYNQETTLGVEVFPSKKVRAGVKDNEYAQFRLTSK
ncbi:MAG TPA: EF-hand domain-containing protein [Gemmataceae bacterium]|nr:EF-hand domain-containing protein [Gemmataceae bacterium]